MRMIFLLGTLFLTILSVACSDLSKDQSKEQPKEEAPCTARFVPVGNNPDIALDTQTGSLCRTVADTNDPLGIRDPNDKTWVRGTGDEKADKYASLPVCNNATIAASTKRIPTFAEWQKSQQVGLCENPDHKVTVAELRKYAEKKRYQPERCRNGSS
jgi:glucose dehydrogenase